MRRARSWAAALCVLALVGGCTDGTPRPTTPTVPSSAGTATPSPSVAPLDLTSPGAALTMVRRLVQAAGTGQVIMVTLRQREASVTVVDAGRTRTFAYRGGAVTEVVSDITYVAQVGFDPDDFNLTDLGALFRTAASVSGSAANQELQIIDQRRVEHSAVELRMSVATNPETRAVFFNRDGTLVPTLSFNTRSGIATGLSDAVGSRVSATSVSVSSTTGATVEYPSADGTASVRRRRTAKLPVVDEPRAMVATRTFDPNDVSAAVIWSVLARAAATGSFGPTTTWSVVAEVRAPNTVPRLYFTIGAVQRVTDLAGREVSA